MPDQLELLQKRARFALFMAALVLIVILMPLTVLLCRTRHWDLTWETRPDSKAFFHRILEPTSCLHHL